MLSLAVKLKSTLLIASRTFIDGYSSLFSIVYFSNTSEGLNFHTTTRLTVVNKHSIIEVIEITKSEVIRNNGRTED